MSLSQKQTNKQYLFSKLRRKAKTDQYNCSLSIICGLDIRVTGPCYK